MTPKSRKIAILCGGTFLALMVLRQTGIGGSGMAIELGRWIGLGFGLLVIVILAYTFWELLADAITSMGGKK